MNITDLKPNFYAFGGRGDVWEKTAHIAKNGGSATLCGKPMLSSNWVRIENVQSIGCRKCLKVYNSPNMDETIYQNIREELMEQHGFNQADMDVDSNEDKINREADKRFQFRYGYEPQK